MESEKTGPVIKEILSAFVIIVVIGTLFVLNLILPPPEMLEAERRVPASFPGFGTEELFSGAFTGGFEDWAADSFVFRDTFRGINSFFVFEVYRQSDKEGLYRDESVGLGRFTRIDSDTLEEAARRILKVSESFDGLDMNLYYSIIPDKGIYSKTYLPGYSYIDAWNVMSGVLTDFEFVYLRSRLDADSYYKTDLHWDQSKISDAADMLLAEMLLAKMYPVAQTGSFQFAAAGEFKGVYAGQYALPFAPPDMMAYADVRGLKVSYLNDRTQEPEEGAMYDFGSLAGIDPYGFFLSGPQPVVVIENGNAPERELYMFRDSFGSSLAPLLAGSYSKIALIDLRYIHLSMLDRFVEFKSGSDVLFIYSSQILANPEALQVGASSTIPAAIPANVGMGG